MYVGACKSHYSKFCGLYFNVYQKPSFCDITRSHHNMSVSWLDHTEADEQIMSVRETVSATILYDMCKPQVIDSILRKPGTVITIICSNFC